MARKKESQVVVKDEFLEELLQLNWGKRKLQLKAELLKEQVK